MFLYFPFSTNTLEILLTGSDELYSESINVFPNPASDVVYLKSDESITSVKVFNYTGQVVMNKSIDNRSYKLDVSQLQDGIYFLIMEIGEKSVSRQIIKK